MNSSVDKIDHPPFDLYVYVYGADCIYPRTYFLIIGDEAQSNRSQRFCDS